VARQIIFMSNPIDATERLQFAISGFYFEVNSVKNGYKILFAAFLRPGSTICALIY